MCIQFVYSRKYTQVKHMDQKFDTVYDKKKRKIWTFREDFRII